MTIAWARAWHLLTGVVAVVALTLQTALVISGESVLSETDVPPLGLRLTRLIAYFTIQSNVLVAVAALSLVPEPGRDGRAWRVLRLASVIGITVTGIVHFFLLRPIQHLTGLNSLADTLLHLVVPILAVVGWAMFGPRPRIDGVTIGWSFVWPVAWVAETMVVGAATGWYPYPFLDAGTHGWGPALGAIAGVLVLAGILFALAALLDRRLDSKP